MLQNKPDIAKKMFQPLKREEMTMYASLCGMWKWGYLMNRLSQEQLGAIKYVFKHGETHGLHLTVDFRDVESHDNALCMYDVYEKMIGEMRNGSSCKGQ